MGLGGKSFKPSKDIIEQFLTCLRIFPSSEEFNKALIIVISMIYEQYFQMAYVWTVERYSFYCGQNISSKDMAVKCLALFICYMQPLPQKTEPAPIL